MRASASFILAAALIAVATIGTLAAEPDVERETEVRVVLQELDRTLADVQRDIDDLDAWIADADVILFEVNGTLVPFDLDEVDSLLPLARNLLSGEPELRGLLAERDPRIARMVSILESTPDTFMGLAAAGIKAALRQDEAEKERLATARLAELDAEHALVDDLIDALQEELDTLASAGPGGEAEEFPPAWLAAGTPGIAASAHLGASPPAREPSFTVNHRASVSEPCWTLDDGLHWCYREGLGWVSVHQSTDAGLRWFGFEERIVCDLVIDGRVEGSDGIPLGRGRYECPELEGFEFTTRGY